METGQNLEKRFTDETLDSASLAAAQIEIQEAFAVGAQAKLETLMPTLERLLEQERKKWSPSLLRALFEKLFEQVDKRLLSSQYESRFWNLAGFFLRPGMGYPLDDYRIKQLWKIILADFKKPKSEDVQLQQWICFRRIAAGLSKGQQIQLFQDLSNSKVKKTGYAYAEHLRALAALELVEIPGKIKLGNTLVKKIGSGLGEPCDYWAIGRLGARLLFHGTAANVIPRTICEEWVHALLKSPKNDHLPFALALLARKINIPSLDLSPTLLDQIAPFLQSQDLSELDQTLTHKEQERIFGDSLPLGLILGDYSLA